MSLETSDQYEECEICGGSIDSFNPGYYKSPSESFRHAICHEKGEPPEGYVLEADKDEDRACLNHQFNCGHTVYLPPADVPMFCPECNERACFPDGSKYSTSTPKQVEPSGCE